jgi:hypothetical protein
MKDFKLNFNSLGFLVAELTKMITSAPNKAYRVNVVGWREKRSLSQNSLYWKWMAELSSQAKVNGKKFSGEIWAEFFKKYYCPSKSVEMPLGESSTTKTTTNLDTGEMHHYLNNIQAWCMREGYSLTIPSDSEYQQLLDKQEQ